MTEEIDLQSLDQILKRYEAEEGSLIPILQATQEVYGYLQEKALVHITEKIRVPLSQIYGVVTFYAQFYLTRRGRNTVRVCRGTACYVRGGRGVLRAVKQRLGIEEGETTADFNFSLETVACLGTCFLAPVMMVNRNYYGKLVPQKVESVLKQYG